MRCTARIVLVFLALLVAATISHCQQTSAVITPQAPVYTQSSSKSRVLRTLEQGQRVMVEMTISNSEGTWCLVREVGSKEKMGYLPCSQLTSDALPKPAPSIPVFSSLEPPTPSGSGESQGAAGRDPYALTEAQKAELQRLKEVYGIESLRDDAVRAYRRFGVSDDFSALNRTVQAGKRPYSDSFFAVMEPKIRRGAVQYKAYWQAYWNLLSQAQRNELAKRSPAFILFYLGVQSDPESAFNAYVLAELRRTSRAK